MILKIHLFKMINNYNRKGGDIDMAKKRIKQSSQQLSTKAEMKDTLQTIKKKEFWIGLATVAAFLFVVIKAIPSSSMNLFSRDRSVISPLPTSMEKRNIQNTIVPTKKSVSMTPAPTRELVKKEVKQEGTLKKVSALADTNGLYVVQESDSYYTISVKACGTGVYFESIQYANGDKALYAGDTVEIVCAQ